MKDNEICVWLTPDQLNNVTELLRDMLAGVAGDPLDLKDPAEILARWREQRAGFVEEHVAHYGRKERRAAVEMLARHNTQADVLSRLVDAGGGEGVCRE